jgi:hypothetical protein
MNAQRVGRTSDKSNAKDDLGSVRRKSASSPQTIQHEPSLADTSQHDLAQEIPGRQRPERAFAEKIKIV